MAVMPASLLGEGVAERAPVHRDLGQQQACRWKVCRIPCRAHVSHPVFIGLLRRCSVPVAAIEKIGGNSRFSPPSTVTWTCTGTLFIGALPALVRPPRTLSIPE